MGGLTFYTLALTIISVSMSAFAQIVLKMGMSSDTTRNVLENGSFIQKGFSIATSPFVIWGLGLYFFGAVIWLFVLSKIDVSQAYPFVGLGFVITIFLAWIILGETISIIRLTGCLLILSGIFLVANS